LWCSPGLPQANHWLYLEQPDVFNKLVADFVHNGFKNVSRVLHV
jgi:hypothetical protein